LLTVAAIVFAALNFQQRSRVTVPDDGITWVASAHGVAAWHVEAGSPADLAGIRKGDIVESVRGVQIHRATDVPRVLWRAGVWSEVPYQIRRDGETFTVPLVTAPQPNSLSLHNYLRITALLYLFIGLFIFVRRWNAPRAIHFYVFCLASFILYSFHYTGKLNSFDWIIYWSNAVALFLQPALLVHFALVFPERRSALWAKLTAVYGLPAILLGLHVMVAKAWLDFMPSIGSGIVLDKIETAYVGAYFLLAAGIFLASYLRAPSGILKQQLKWVTGGTFAGIVPFLAVYALPGLFAGALPRWTEISVFSLILIPLCFGYAIIRYRLMDVDIIFKRGLAYTFATGAVVAIYFSSIALVGELTHTTLT
ncbi:MAG: PDZ domain-containing protein, partial [Terracidiphilus sp.]